MARRYARDNRGRFASVGATARGGRLATASGNKRATQTKVISSGKPGGTVGKPKGLKPGSIKPKAIQNKEAKAERVQFAKERSREAAFLKSLPKPTRSAIRLARKSRNETLGASQRMAVNEGATTLRSNFGKRKPKLSQGEIQALSNAVAGSGRKLRVALADPVVGRQLRRNAVERRAARTTQTRAISGGKPGSTVGKPKGLKPGAIRLKPIVKSPEGVKWAGNNAARIGVKPPKRSGKGQRVAGKSPAGTISQSKDTRNKQARKAAFKRRVNRASDNLRGAGKTYNTYAEAHKYGNAPGQGTKIERSYKQALQREATAKKALAVYQGTARPTVNDSRVYGRPYGMSRPAVSRTSKGYKAPSERLRAPSQTAQREARAMKNHLRAENRRNYTGRSRPATAGTSTRALQFYRAPKSFLKVAKDKRNQKLTEGAGFRMPRSLRR